MTMPNVDRGALPASGHSQYPVARHVVLGSFLFGAGTLLRAPSSPAPASFAAQQ